jgi:small-conductance mechanosensitive channel
MIEGWIGIVVAALLGVLVQYGLYWILRRSFRQNAMVLRLLERSTRAARFALALLVVLIASPALVFSPGAASVLHEAGTLAGIGLIGWLLIVVIHLGEDIVHARLQAADPSSLAARRVRTRTTVLRRVLKAIVVVLTVSSALMTFPEVRTLGASILASAGLIGLIAGLAAQPVLSNLIAGLQIALTQPVRIDDVVVVNGDWGVIEEIGATYVVLQIWDLRRLIVPLSYFLQNPVENWTYRGTDIIGYTYVYADYRVSVDAVRSELQRILEASPDWDRKSWSLQVTSLDEKAVQMRALFSASDSNHRWNLIVDVQEKLVKFLQERYPEHLPRMRVDVSPFPQRVPNAPGV